MRNFFQETISSLRLLRQPQQVIHDSACLKDIHIFQVSWILKSDKILSKLRHYRVKRVINIPGNQKNNKTYLCEDRVMNYYTRKNGRKDLYLRYGEENDLIDLLLALEGW